MFLLVFDIHLTSKQKLNHLGLWGCHCRKNLIIFHYFYGRLHLIHISLCARMIRYALKYYK